MFVIKILKRAQKMPLPEQCPPLLGRLRRLKPIDRKGAEAIEPVPGRGSDPAKMLNETMSQWYMQPLCRNQLKSAAGRLFHELFTLRKKIFHARFERVLRFCPSLTRAILLTGSTRRDEMNSTENLTRGPTTGGFPPLRQPKPETADTGTVRLGSGNITAGFPPLRQPKPETADTGTVRLGSGNITAGFPPLRQPRPETADTGAVRLGSGNITAGFPPLRQPRPETADTGAVRLGSGNITAAFPPLRRPKPETADIGTVRLGSGNITAAFPSRR
jgi:hypothetical protein